MQSRIKRAARSTAKNTRGGTFLMNGAGADFSAWAEIAEAVCESIWAVSNR